MGGRGSQPSISAIGNGQKSIKVTNDYKNKEGFAVESQVSRINKLLSNLPYFLSTLRVSNRRINKVETELLPLAFIIGAAKKSP